MEREISEQFFLSASETNAERELSLPTLTAKIIDIATRHANSLGIGNPSMSALNCGWVLSRLAIEMQRYPKVNETYKLTTWVEVWNKHFSERSFAITDSHGEEIGHARSIWMVLNTDTHESVGLSHLSLAADMISDRIAPIPRQGRARTVVTPSADGTPIGRNEIEANAPAVEHTFRYCDLDFYRHVNTIRYIELLLNQYTLQEMDETEVERMELSFMHEGEYGKPLTLLRSDNGEASDFTLCNQEGTALLNCFIRRRVRRH